MLIFPRLPGNFSSLVRTGLSPKENEKRIGICDHYQSACTYTPRISTPTCPCILHIALYKKGLYYASYFHKHGVKGDRYHTIAAELQLVH